MADSRVGDWLLGAGLGRYSGAFAKMPVEAFVALLMQVCGALRSRATV